MITIKLNNLTFFDVSDLMNAGLNERSNECLLSEEIEFINDRRIEVENYKMIQRMVNLVQVIFKR